MWVGTNNGLNIIDLKTEKVIRTFNHQSTNSRSISANTINVILKDKQGQIWIGCGSGFTLLESYQARGLNKYNSKTNDFRRYISSNSGLSNDNINSILQDKTGDLWIGTYGGLFHLNHKSKQIKAVKDEDGMPHCVVMGILESSNGNLWLSTLNGLIKYDPKLKRHELFTKNDGLQDNRFNVDAYCKLKNGNFIFGGANGFNCFHPDSVPTNAFPPKIVLTGFKTNSKTVHLDTAINAKKRIQLDYKENVFTISFAALNFQRTNKNQYQYKLEGYDKTWVNAGTHTSASYSNVPPGNYEFVLKGSNNDGVWSIRKTPLTLTIVPPFWLTNWFKGSVLIILASSFVLFFQLRYQRLRKLARERLNIIIETQESERERISRELHDGVGAKLSTIGLLLSATQSTNETKHLLDQSKNLNSDVVIDIRRLLFDLSPQTLENGNFIHALEEMIAGLPQITPIIAVLNISGDAVPLEKNQATALFRICQELINNTLKYAKATELKITITFSTSRIQLKYEDNGIGFDQSNIKSGYGLKNIHTRIRLMLGDLSITSKVNKGTHIQISVPYSTLKP